MVAPASVTSDDDLVTSHDDRNQSDRAAESQDDTGNNFGKDTAEDESARATSARAFSIGMALSCASWVILGFVNAAPEDRFTVVRLGLCALHGTTAVLFALRVPAQAEGSVLDVCAALPSLILSGLLFRLAPAPSLWPVWAQAVFGLGAVFTVWSLGTLGKSFALVPARRDLVTKGPYALVRHPAYLGELTMTTMFAATAALASSASRWQALALLACLAPALVWRILTEDAVMRDADGWSAYASRTTKKLIPALW